MGGGASQPNLPSNLTKEECREITGEAFNEETFDKLAVDGVITKEQFLQKLRSFRPFPQLGIAMSAIDDFIQTVGGVSKLEGMTTTDVCVNYIIPMTKDKNCSYCDQIIQQKTTKKNPNNVNKSLDKGINIANVFVSHAWKYNFLNVIETLRQSQQEEEKEGNNKQIFYFWFDLFSNNQHDTSNIPYEWWEGTFKSAIRRIGKTILIIHPWNNPIPLTRAWCLFEIFCSVDSNSKFDISMTLDQYNIFLDMLMNDYDSVMKMIAIVDLSNSQSFLPLDRERILKVVSDSVGIQTLNKIVIDKLWNWVITTLSIAVEKETVITLKLKLQNRLGLLYRQQGRYEDAIQLFIQLLDLQKLHLKEDHLDTMETMNNLAEAYGMLYQYDQARNILQECLEMKKRILTIKHPDTLLSMHELAWILMCEEKYDIANELFNECLQMRQEILGPNHLDTLLTMTQQARLFCDSLNFQKGLPQYEYCVEMLEKHYGKDHHKALMAKQMYVSALCDASKDLERGIGISLDNIEILQVKFPNAVEDVILNYLYIARIKRVQKLWKESYDIIRVILNYIIEKRGESDGEYREFLMEYIDTCFAANDFDEAEKISSESYAIFLKYLGKEDYETMIIASAFGLSLLKIGKEAEAEKILKDVRVYFQSHSLDDDEKSHYRFLNYLKKRVLEEKIIP